MRLIRTFQPHSSAPLCSYSLFSRSSGHSHIPAFLPRSSLGLTPPLWRRAPSLSSNHSYFQEGGVWVEGFLQTNQRLWSVRGPGWGRS